MTCHYPNGIGDTGQDGRLIRSSIRLKEIDVFLELCGFRHHTIGISLSERRPVASRFVFCRGSMLREITPARSAHIGEIQPGRHNGVRSAPRIGRRNAEHARKAPLIHFPGRRDKLRRTHRAAVATRLWTRDRGGRRVAAKRRSDARKWYGVSWYFHNA